MNEFEKELDKTFDGSYITTLNHYVEIKEHFKDWQPPREPVVVPQFVADAIESIPNYYSAYGAIKLIDMKLSELPLANEDWKCVHDWIFVDDNADKFSKAWIDGYTVEKEKLYYLKHIDLSETDKYYDWFMTKFSDDSLGHLRFKKGEKPKTIDCQFTQSEIDKLHIGSYEQIEVD